MLFTSRMSRSLKVVTDDRVDGKESEAQKCGVAMKAFKVTNFPSS